MSNRSILRKIRRSLKSRREYDIMISTRGGWFPAKDSFKSYLAVLSLNRHPKKGESTISREFLNGDKIWRTTSKKKKNKEKKGYKHIFFFPAFAGTVLEGRINSRQTNQKVYYLVVPHRRSHLIKVQPPVAIWWVRKMASVWGVLWGEFRAIPATYRVAVYERDQGRCVNCHGKTALEYDHIIPFSKGGATSIDNLQLLCQRCNRRKYNHIREPIPDTPPPRDPERKRMSIFKKFSRNKNLKTTYKAGDITI